MNYKLLTAYAVISKYPLALCAALGLIILTGCAHNTTGPDSSYFKANGKDINITDFNKAVSEMMDDMGVPGMSLAIIENDEVVFSKGYGMRRLGEAKDADQVNNFAYGYSVKDLDIDKEVDCATVFNGASLSKTFLAFVALQLADEGKLDLDKPMFQYMEYARLAHDDRYKLITARMALSHSSGLENWQNQNDGNTLEIMNTPGEAFIYSGEGYNFLALVIKQILQESYTVYVQQRVIEGLGLENSYLKYNQGENPISLDQQIPSNFAAGHPLSGGQYLIRNTGVQPAFANHFNAEDYAKLTLAMFNTAHLSAERRSDMLDPKVKISKSSVYYGAGFKLIFTEGDTIISHGGDNPGYKNLMFYSPVKKRGFVMLTNNDRGKSMTSKLNEMSVGLEVDDFLVPSHDLVTDIQYPNVALPLLKIFDEKDSAAMFSELEVLKTNDGIDAKAFNRLAMFFLWYGDNQIGLKLLQDASVLFPDSPLTYCLLGDYYLGNEEYQLALDNFSKSKALNFSHWDIDDEIEKCKKELSAVK